jgi:hypothetical protein
VYKNIHRGSEKLEKMLLKIAANGRDFEQVLKVKNFYTLKILMENICVGVDGFCTYL